METKLSERLRMERIRQRISQWVLGLKTGIDPSRISRFENNLLQLSDPEITKIREALGLVKEEK
jgi:transcriptional regulator with XRE-family HTH domain